MRFIVNVFYNVFFVDKQVDVLQCVRLLFWQVLGMCGKYNKIHADDLEADGIVQPQPQDFVYAYSGSCRERVSIEDPCDTQTELVYALYATALTCK